MHSYAEKRSVNCNTCQQSFEADVWQIVDTVERPDLVKRLQRGNLHCFVCPGCKQVALEADVPLLLYRPQRHPVLIFSPATAIDSTQNQQVAQRLIGQLQNTLSKQWQDTWLEQGLLAIPRTHLVNAVDRNLEAAPSAAAPSISPQVSNDLGAILQELGQLNRPTDHPHKIQLLQQALRFVTRDSQPQIWAMFQGELGNSFAQTFQGDRAENIEQAIRAYQQALTVLTKNSAPHKWAQTFGNLANAYATRIRGDRAENIEQAINAYQKALMVITKSAMSSEWAIIMMNLATTYSERIHGDKAENIEQAIGIYKQILTLSEQHAMPAEQVIIMMNLANAYSERIHGDKAENIEQAIYTYKKVLEELKQVESPFEWTTTLNNLANAYLNRIRGDRAKNIEQAISFYKQVLQVRKKSVTPVEWSQTVMNLANAYHYRIRGDRAKNIEQAIDAYAQALTVITEDKMPADWATVMTNLANAYSDRIRGDRAENIEQAIDAYEQALTVRTEGKMPIKWATTMMNLANAYSDRIRGDRAKNIEQAIDAYAQALTVITEDKMPADWATVMTNLANAYSDRIRGDRAENIEQAIDAYEQALTVRTEGKMPIKWATTMMNLANAHRNRLRGDKAKNIEQAIGFYKKALTAIKQGEMPVDWANITNNLANTYLSRIYGDRSNNVEQAIGLYRRALTVIKQDEMPVDWASITNNLAAAYRNRLYGNQAENVDQAISFYNQALIVRTQSKQPIEWAQTIKNLATAYRDRLNGNQAENIDQAINFYNQALTIFQPTTLPVDCRHTARLLGNLYVEIQKWPQAVSTYNQALAASELLYQSSLFRSSQDAELAATGDLYRRAAVAFAHTNGLKTAVVTLEQGRARALSEVLERNQADLSQLKKTYPDVYRRYRQAAEDLRQLETLERASSINPDQPQVSLDDLRQQANNIRAALTHVLNDIRQIRGYETFLTLPTFDTIAAAVTPQTPLIYLVATPSESLALILYAADTATTKSMIQVTPVWFNSFSETDLNALLVRQIDNETVGGWLGAYDAFLDDPKANHDQWLDVIDQATQQLWSIMAPIIKELESLNLNKAILIPTGLFGLLPLHAAWTEDTQTPTERRYASDQVAFTYAPNARSLLTAQRIATTVYPESILAIDEPQPTQASPLPNSQREVQAAVESFPTHHVLRHEQATRTAVLDALPHYAVLHCSCHGQANPNQPLDSSLVMANDEFLTLRDLLDLKLNGIRLAILSACETAIPGLKLPDEVYNLPTGLLQAGVAGIAASLWSVPELSTMMLLTRFYDFWRTEHLEPAEALRQAQHWIRDTTNGEKAAYFRDFIPQLSGTKMPASTADYLYKSFVLSRPEARDFAHPFHWAAFTYVGV